MAPVQDPQNSNQVDLTITGSGANNLPTRQSLTWAVGSGSWGMPMPRIGRVA